MTIHRKAVEQYFTVVLFVFELINFGLDTARSVRINKRTLQMRKLCLGQPT